jgi:hypothetical protein
MNYSSMNRVRMGMIVSAIVAPLALGAMGRAFSADHVTDANKTVSVYKRADPVLAATSVGTEYEAAFS